MDHISKTLEVAQSALVTNSTRSQEETLKKTGLQKSWVSAIFKRLQARYGHKWTSTIDGIEEVAVNEWSARLSGLTGEEIKRGLNEWSGEWPPSADEFRDACLGKKSGKNEFGIDYIPECYRSVQRTLDKSKLLSSDDREKRRDAVKRNISSLKDALKKKQ